MRFFEVLRLEPTTDQTAIKRAYTRLVKMYPPETHQTEFQELREAYEQAVAYSQSGGAESDGPDDPLFQFNSQVEKLYADYSARINANNWKLLLESEICHHLDTSEEASRIVLDFFADHYYLPHAVWAACNEQFGWDKKREKLLEGYTEGFVDYLMGRIKRDNFFRYDKLLHCENGQQDIFISHYFEGMNTLEQFDYYTALQAMNKAQEIDPGHPDLLILKAKYDMAVGRLGPALDQLTGLTRQDRHDYYATYYRSVLLYRMGHYEEAYSGYQSILPSRPEATDVLFSLGKCAVSIGRHNEAIGYLKQLDDILPHDEEVINLLLSAYRFRIDELNAIYNDEPQNMEAGHELVAAYLACHQLEEAYRLLTELEEKHPSVRLYVQLAQALTRLGKRELALTTVNKALDLFPNEVDLLMWKADLVEEFGQIEEAIAYYNEVIRLKPDEAIAYNNMAFVLNRLERYEEALASAETAVSYDPSMSNSYRHKAEALLNLERYQECYEACEAALERNKFYTEAYITEMKLYNAVEQSHNALEVFNRAARLDLKDGQLYVQKARALKLQENYPAAIQACEQALELDENHKEAIKLKGICHYDQDQYQEALLELNKLTEEYQKEEEACYYAALSYYLNNQPDEALKLALAVINRGAARPEVFYHVIGDVRRDKEDPEGAREAYQMAVDYNPEWPSYRYKLAILLNDNLTWRECIEHLDKVIELDPNAIEAREHKLHALFTHAQNFEASIQTGLELLELDPDNSDAYDFLAWSYYMQDKKEIAKAYLQEGLQKHSDHVSMLHIKLIMLMEGDQTREALAVCDRILDLDPQHEDTLARRSELLDAGQGSKKSLFKWLKK
ncbi:hypothetical protein PghCCS26_07470 [Paenibacillus glycanilyticus]|uniref:J domain-containing protein n=1 Tax=Paenibacillus glycanilyticus TaxID=126569 RepID=A0ABQ6NHK1_9BACL|nr:tetratricopeptide repeat protein [Paenibacillus glycanilyticus]GMK43620.1 hypothetical protein PghCCS26_07470 [Paenibacillus glycanilyticus]